MSFVRLPRFLEGFEPVKEGEIHFNDAVDLHPADRVVFRDGSDATVNAVTYPPAGGTVVVLGQSPAFTPPKREPRASVPEEMVQSGLLEVVEITPDDVGVVSAEDLKP